MSRVSSVRTPRWSVRHRERGLAGGSLLLLLFLYAPVFASGFAGRPHFWVWSELHINYAAGFVRRNSLKPRAAPAKTSAPVTNGCIEAFV